MQKQYLWVDRRGADLHWSALGNVDIGPVGKSTLVMWVRQPVTSVPWLDDRPFTIYCSSGNWVTSCLGHGIQVMSGGTTYERRSQVDRTRTGGWELLTYQWDFSQGLVQSFYNDARPGAPAMTGVPAPIGMAQHIQIGAPYSSPTAWGLDNLLIHGVAVWDELLGPEQITAIYQRGYLEEFQESDGAGNLTLLLRLNERLEADIAGGDTTCTVGATTPKDRYCFLPEGIRRMGLQSYALGMPRQDGSEDDRKPLNAVLPLNWDQAAQQTALTANNLTTYSVLRVQNFSEELAAGARCLPVPRPGTYRQMVHVPDENNVAGMELGLGPVMYKHYPSASEGVFDHFGSGRGFTVVEDAGNSPTAFKTDLDVRFGTDYWKDAWVTFYTGACAGRRLKVTGYDGGSRVLTLETALPATPAAGNVGMVNPYPRLLGRTSPYSAPDHRYTMEANLWAHHDTINKAFKELEWCNNYVLPFLRFQRGRTAVMPGVAQQGGDYGVLYGKTFRHGTGTVNLELWLRKVEVQGPQRYQILRRTLNQPGPALADNFMVLTRDSQGTAGDSVKVWRKQNLALAITPPTKYGSWSQATADLAATGTWRHQPAGSPIPVVYDEDTHTPVCAMLGKDPEGKIRLGYVVPQWEEASGRILWSDETPPAGKQNPCLEWSTLRSDTERDAPVWDQGWLQGVVQSADGSWSLLYGNRADFVDDEQTFALHGAKDRWSFEFATQFRGPVVPMLHGVDGREPLSGNGFTLWSNMHAPWSVVQNPHAQQIEQRYVGYAGGKTIYNDGNSYSLDTRVGVGCMGADVKALAPLPYGNTITPLACPQLAGWATTILGQEDSIGILFGWGTTCGIGLATSEDGVHFQQLFSPTPGQGQLIKQAELPGESTHLEPGSTLRLGDRRVYYYWFDYYTRFNFAAIRWNGETAYKLSEGETEGWLETPILERPEGGWPELFLNAAPGGGEIEVELRDPAQEQPLPGWGREDCDAVGDSVRGAVTWGSQGLGQLAVEHVRLRFYLRRPTAETATPVLYGWETGTQSIIRPQVSQLQVEGETAPAALGVSNPRFSWCYESAAGRPQAAFQVQVASSEARLAAGTPDMWDTGPVVSSATSVLYTGQPLEDNQMYFWRVRARDTEGVWSEEW